MTAEDGFYSVGVRITAALHLEGLQIFGSLWTHDELYMGSYIWPLRSNLLVEKCNM